MNTSNYYKNGNNPNAVSIAGKCPDFYKGREYKLLAPKWWFYKKYKEDRDSEFYIIQYQKEVLDKLDPNQVYEDLGENAILLCYEKETDFCHRFLVAKWLEKYLNITILEI